MLQLVFSSHGQPSVTCWEVPGSHWFPFPSDSCTFQRKGYTFTEKRKFPRTWRRHGMQCLFTEEQGCYKEKVHVSHLTRAWHRRGTKHMWGSIVLWLLIRVMFLIPCPLCQQASPFPHIILFSLDKMTGCKVELHRSLIPLLLPRGFWENPGRQDTL